MRFLTLVPLFFSSSVESWKFFALRSRMRMMMMMMTTTMLMLIMVLTMLRLSLVALVESHNAVEILSTPL